VRASLLFLCGLTLAASVFAETNLTLTVDGVTYSNVTFGTATPAWVSVRHATGATTISLAKLPPDLQKQFGYDPQKAADWQIAAQKAAVERVNTERRKALLKKYTSQDLPDTLEVGVIGKIGLGLRVVQVLDPDRMLLHRFMMPAAYSHGSPGWSSPFCLQGLPTSNYVDDRDLELSWTGTVVKVTGTMNYVDVEGGQRTIFVVEPYDVK